MRMAISGSRRKQVLAEEKRLIDFVQSGRGKFKPFNAGAHQFQNETLSDEQRKAVLHVLQSTDRVTAIRGGAGTGKTTMMKEAVAAIESGGHKVFTFAPSAEASRGVLRSDAGFANAETVEALLQSSKLQEQVRGQVIWIDEAGLLGSRRWREWLDLAERENCRIILSGDTAQHRAVERGDALRILEKHADLQAAELKEIWRQKADSHKAIDCRFACWAIWNAPSSDGRTWNAARAWLRKIGMKPWPRTTFRP